MIVDRLDLRDGRMGDGGQDKVGTEANLGFVRTMGALGALFITLSGLSPSIGVFVVGADVLHQAGSATFLCFLAAGLLGSAIANVYAELAAAFPETGGEYTIVGRILGPSWGLAMLGLNLLTFSIGPAITGLGVSGYLHGVLPGLPQIPTAMALVALCMGVSILNVRLNALVTGLFLALELASLGLVAGLGLLHPHRALGEALAPAMLGPAGHLQPVTLASLGLGAAAAIYAFDGYGAVVYLGEELHEAPRKIAKVVFWALGLAALFMLAPILGALVGAPDLPRLFAAEQPLPALAADLGGPVVSQVLSLAVALALFNAMIASALMGGRHLYSSGRDGVWPRGMSEALARLHPRFNSPWVATLAIGVTSILWCLVRLDLLLILIGDGTAAIYLCMSLAALKGRKGVAAHAPYRMPLFPWIPVLALLGLSAVGAADLLTPDGREGLLASAVVAVAAVAYYRLAVRKSGRWAHRGPSAGG
jgi:amino acid transporter